MTAIRMFLVYAKMKPLPGNYLKMEEEDLEILWHKRYGHLNNKSIQIMQQKQLVKGLPKFKGAETMFAKYAMWAINNVKNFQRKANGEHKKNWN